MIATSERRLYSTILAQFPWYSEALASKPESILAHSEDLPGFKVSYFLVVVLIMGESEQCKDIPILIIQLRGCFTSFYGASAYEGSSAVIGYEDYHKQRRSRIELRDCGFP